MVKRIRLYDKDQEYDPQGAHGGDTGKTKPVPGGEKGDRRRMRPIHHGPTRPGAQSKRHLHGNRSGSDRNES